MADNPTTVDPCPRHPKGRMPAHFARQNAKSQVRKMLKRDEVAHLIATEKKTQAEAAQAMGISERWVAQLWREAELAARHGDLTSEETKEDVRTMCSAALHHTLKTSVERVEDTAAYGAIVVAAAKTLLEMHGCASPEAGSGNKKKDFEESMKRAKAVSPLLFKRLAGLEKPGEEKKFEEDEKKRREEEAAR